MNLVLSHKLKSSNMVEFPMSKIEYFHVRNKVSVDFKKGVDIEKIHKLWLKTFPTAVIENGEIRIDSSLVNVLIINN